MTTIIRADRAFFAPLPNTPSIPDIESDLYIDFNASDLVGSTVVADLKQYKQAANNLLTASQKAQTVLDTTQAKFSTFTEAYQNEMRINPIDCVGTDGRLRSILDLYPSTSTRRND